MNDATFTKKPILVENQRRKTLVGSLLVSTVELSAEAQELDSLFGLHDGYGGGNIETYVFPANPETGKVTDWGELWGERCRDEPNAIAAQHERGILWARSEGDD